MCGFVQRLPLAHATYLRFHGNPHFRSDIALSLCRRLNWKMRASTRIEYEERITEVVSAAIGDIDRKWTTDELAGLAGFSRFHFHRVFEGMMSESLGEMMRRLRLERAALRLEQGNETVTEIAIGAGYSHEGFCRAFKTAYIVTPSEYRNRPSSHHLASPNGVHYPFQGKLIFRGGTGMKPTIRIIGPTRYLCVRHVGPYNEIGASFGKLMGLAGPLGIAPVGPAGAFYHDDPSTVAATDLRSDAGIPVSPTQNTPIEGASYLDVPEQECLVVLHKGSYQSLGDSWNRAYGEALAESGREPLHAPPFELYLNDCNVVPEADLLTEICIPLKPLAVSAKA